jgi:hypothetical protein
MLYLLLRQQVLNMQAMCPNQIRHKEGTYTIVLSGQDTQFSIKYSHPLHHRLHPLVRSLSVARLQSFLKCNMTQ